MALTKVSFSMINGDSINPFDYGVTGDGTTNDAAGFNAALQAAAGKILYIPKQSGSFYLVGDNLVISSNTTIVCEPGVVIKTSAGTFGTADAIFYMNEVDNVTIHGNGAILQGLREGSGTSVISMGVFVLGSTNVRIYDLKVIDASGDGFYIAGAADNTPIYSDGVWLVNCAADNCMRQGLSIVSCKNLLVDGCRFDNTSGKSPSAGIDIEPDPSGDLYNIRIVNCTADNNDGGGYMVDLNSIDNNVDIVFENCIATGGAGADATGFELSNAFVSSATGDRLSLVNCVAKNTGSYGLLIRNISKVFNGLTIDNFQAINTNTEQVSVYGDAPVAFYSVVTAEIVDPGNVRINGIRVYDETAARTPYYINSASTPWDNIVINGLDWTNTVGTTLPFMQSGTTNTHISWVPTPFRFTRTSDTTLTSRYSGWVLNNIGDTGLQTVTLPAVAAGLSFSFEVVAGYEIRIDPNASDRLWPYASGDGKYMGSSTVGSTATVKANADGTDWVVERFGTWTDEP